MRIIEVSKDQNEIKTDDGKTHIFVETDDFICLLQYTICSLKEVSPKECRKYCVSALRKDKKDGYFKIKE